MFPSVPGSRQSGYARTSVRAECTQGVNGNKGLENVYDSSDDSACYKNAVKSNFESSVVS